MNNYEKLLYKTNRQKRQLRILMAKNKELQQKVNQLETNIDEAIKEIKKRSTPEVAQLYIEILERGKE